MFTLRRACLLSLGLHALAVWIWASWPARDAVPAQPEPPLAVRLAAGSAAAAHAAGALRGGGGLAGSRPAMPARQSQRAEHAGAGSLAAGVAGPQSAPAGRFANAAAAATDAAGGGQISATGGMEAKDEGQSDGDHEALYRPAYLENPQPPYPERSLQLGEEGEVLLSVRVGVNGRALKVTLARSSGFRRLDQAAMDAVARWRFAPARRGGAAAESVLTIPVSFRQ